jgi:hypothetical protein
MDRILFPIGQANEHDPIKLMNIIDDSFLRSDVTRYSRILVNCGSLLEALGESHVCW